jgi:hypothetical protein
MKEKNFYMWLWFLPWNKEGSFCAQLHGQEMAQKPNEKISTCGFGSFCAPRITHTTLIYKKISKSVYPSANIPSLRILLLRPPFHNPLHNPSFGQLV